MHKSIMIKISKKMRTVEVKRVVTAEGKDKGCNWSVVC